MNKRPHQAVPLCLMILIAAVGLTYAGSLGGAFLFDDVFHIVENERIRHLWPPWDLLSVERPVVEVSLAINYAISDLAPWSYHAFNLIVHALAGLTLFGIARQTLKRWGHEATEPRSHTVFDRRATWTAFAIALLFLIHPLQTQSVTYVIQRGESLMGLFFLLTLYAFIRGLDSRRKARWFIASMVCCTLGMATKAVMVTAPIVVLLYDWVFVHRRGSEEIVSSLRAANDPSVSRLGKGGGLPAASPSTAPTSRDSNPRTSSLRGFVPSWLRRLVAPWLRGFVVSWLRRSVDPSYRATLWHRSWWHAGLLATWGVLWLCGIAPEVLGRSDGVSHVGFSYAGLTSLDYALTQPGVIVKYLQLSIWPTSLCLDYDWMAATTWQRIVPPVVVIAILLGVTIRELRRRHWIGFAGAWFFVILSPTSSVVPIKDLMFEHRMYLPLAAVIAVIVVGLREVLSALCNRARLRARTQGVVATILLLNAAVPLALGTIRRNRDYATAETMWRDVVAKRPHNARAYVAVGNALAADGKLEESLEITREAVALAPAFADGQAALGLALARLGRMDEAIAAYQEAVRLNPAHSRAWYNYANALDRQGRLDDAVEAYQSSIATYSGFADAHCNLGSALVRQGRLEEAVAALQETLRLDPNHVKGHNNLGDAFFKLGRLREAATAFESAMRLDPSYLKARINLAFVRQRQGRNADAAILCEEVLSLEPGQPTATELLTQVRAATAP